MRNLTDRIDSEGIISKEEAEIIADIKRRSFTSLIAVAIRFKAKSRDQKWAINDFFEDKIAIKHPERLKQIQKEPLSEIIRHFTDYLIENYRRDCDYQSITDAFIRSIKESESQEKTIKTQSDINVQIDRVIESLRIGMIDRYEETYHPRIFDLIIRGDSNIEITRQTGAGTSIIITTRHQIKNLLKDQKIIVLG